ncbi:hypothetical protein DCC62_23155 [candidate division KSB1 bacterium]|nr:MAG: hypothetical protein DCC62_23155 [candidate division KSB1 bacterium]
MIKRIEKDRSRFRQILRGQIKKELRKYISRGELIGKQGKDIVSIPVHQINLPHFRYSGKNTGGVGQGEGDVGTPIGRGDDQDGSGQAGEAPGDHLLEVDISLVSEKDKYTGISTSGPESLRHFKRTYKQALKRQLITGEYRPEAPRIVPYREDRRYRTWRTVPQPEASAVIIYMMDVSGSMGDEQKEIVRIESFWIDTWLRYQYKNLETRYIIHDAVAREVDQETFYHTRESGGTIISSAYKLAHKIVSAHYNPDDWNIYMIHFSDGDNWGEIDTDECIQILEKKVLPVVNLFCYGQVESPYGSGQFIRDLDDYFDSEERLVLSEIPDKEAIYKSIQEFLGKGK